MQIIDKNIDELIPYEKNPRKNDAAVDKVAASIQEFGFKVPIIVDKDNVIAAGHTRYKAAKELDLETVPCIIADDLTEEQINAFRLADNKTAEFAGWDFDLLAEELKGIEEIDMEQFGFDISEVAEEESEVQEDDFEFTPLEELKAKRGDIYKLGRHRLMCGDSTDVNDVEKLVGGGKADLLITDPPYGINAVKANNKVGGSKPFGKVRGGYIVEANTYMAIKGDDTIDTARDSFYILKAFTNSQIIFGGNYFTEFLPPSPCWLIWDKENTGNFADVEMAWSSFDKGAKLYRWLWNGLCRKGDRKTEGKKRIHPTQKPVGLIGEILKDFSTSGETVIDCFGGSGSTLIACEQLDRTCYMMEYEPRYVDVIIKRWEDFTGEKAELIEGG